MLISKIKNNENRIYFISLLMCGAILISPLIDTKIIPGHDYMFHVSRIEIVANALKQGIFPVRMYADTIQFWGSPNGILYPNLFNYIPAILRLTGLPVEICYNIFIALIFYTGLFVSWYGFSLLTKSKHIGFLASILYISSGYFLLDAYIRSAIGELLALAFMPLAIACIVKLVQKEKVSPKLFFISILTFSAIIEAHVLSSVILALFFITFLIIKHKYVSLIIVKRMIKLSIIIGLLNASFLIPFIIFFIKIPLSLSYMDDFSRSGLRPYILLRFLVYWNFWLFTGLYIFLSTKYHKSSLMRNFEIKYYNLYLLYLLAGFFFLYTSSTLMPWDNIPPIKNFFKFIQFSWRFLGYSTLFLCISGGFGLHHFIKLKSNRTSVISALFGLLICLTCLTTFKYLTPTPFGNMEPKVYWERQLFFSDIDYLYNDIEIARIIEHGNHYVSNAKITNWKKENTTISFSYLAENNSEIILPLINFPGYTAIDQNGNCFLINENDNHMMVITLPKGNGNIKVFYKGLTIFKVADYISLFSLVALLYSSFRYLKKQHLEIQN